MSQIFETSYQYMVDNNASMRSVQRKFSLPWGSWQRYCKKRRNELSSKVQVCPSDSVTIFKEKNVEKTIEQLLDEKSGQYERYERKLNVKNELHIHDDKPFALAFVGDPHLDTNGCDIDELRYHLQILSHTKGMYGVNIGDLVNNWVGRLTQQYSNQMTTEADGWRLVRWYLEHNFWIAHIYGNHDKWRQGEQIINEILRGKSTIRAENSHCRINVKHKKRELRLNLAHNFKGHSQYNKAFGQVKQAFKGDTSDLIIGGHIHSTGYTQHHHDAGISHCATVGGYKKVDPYAIEYGFHDANLGSTGVAVVNTNDDGLDFIKWFWDIQAASDYLKYLRGDF